MSEIIRRYKKNIKDISNSRYANSYLLIDSDGNEYYESQDDLVIPERDSDRLHQVEVSEEGRLDLISYRYYNTSHLWWVIAKASDIYNPLEVKEGDILRVPTMDSIYGYRGVIGI